jgi:hypothetical protein
LRLERLNSIAPSKGSGMVIAPYRSMNEAFDSRNT